MSAKGTVGTQVRTWATRTVSWGPARIQIKKRAHTYARARGMMLERTGRLPEIANIYAASSPKAGSQWMRALLDHPEATSLRSVSPAPVTPWKTYEIVDGLLRPLLGTLEEERFNQPRQALPPAWLHDGVIDVVRREVVLDGSMSGPRLLAWPSDPDEAVDVDHPDDLRRAEAALARLAGREGA